MVTNYLKDNEICEENQCFIRLENLYEWQLIQKNTLELNSEKDKMRKLSLLGNFFHIKILSLIIKVSLDFLLWDMLVVHLSDIKFLIYITQHIH